MISHTGIVGTIPKNMVIFCILLKVWLVFAAELIFIELVLRECCKNHLYHRVFNIALFSITYPTFQLKLRSCYQSGF